MTASDCTGAGGQPGGPAPPAAAAIYRPLPTLTARPSRQRCRAQLRCSSIRLAPATLRLTSRRSSVHRMLVADRSLPCPCQSWKSTPRWPSTSRVAVAKHPNSRAAAARARLPWPLLSGLQCCQLPFLPPLLGACLQCTPSVLPSRSPQGACPRCCLGFFPAACSTPAGPCLSQSLHSHE